MKKKFSKILGVGLTVALLASLLLVAAPVLADVSQPTVDVESDEISDWADYTIIFVVANDLAEGGTISITFPEDTDIIDITDAADADVTISATSGIGSSAFGATQAGSAIVGQQLTIIVPDVNVEDKIGAGATVQVAVSGVVNPSFPGYYTLAVHTSQETTPVDSNAYVITVPLHAPWPFVSITTGQSIISLADADYAISIGLGEELGAGDTITVTFPSDTVVSAPTATFIGLSIGWIGGIYKDATLNAVTWTADTATRTVTATLGTGDEVGELAWVWIEITAGITNPSVPGDYTLTVHTSQETTPVESNAYTIRTPPDPALPGIVEVYNPSMILMNMYTGDNAIRDAIAQAGEDYTIKVYTGTYTTNVDVNVDHLTIQSENGPEVTTVRAANSNDHVFEVTADNVTISGFSIFGATDAGRCGIMFLTVSGCTIENNRCGWDDNHRNYAGIHLLDSNDSNSISDNTCNSNLYFGIFLSSSSNNTISGNTCNLNGHRGIHLQESSNSNTLSHNTCNSNDYGIYLYSSSSNAISDNICNSNASSGIYLSSSSSNAISGNTCNLNSYHGIRLYNSSNNTITSNTTNDNNYGIRLYNSSSNTIYLNNFTNNTVNVYSEDSTNSWNSPEEITYIYHGNTYTHYLGNYWSDYLGSDSDGDGIGDTPYSIDGDNDNCPLMESFENYATPSACFIATASYDAPSNQDIAALRSFRDKVLAKTPLGEALVKVYYSASPPVARALAQNDGLRTATRLLLVIPLSYLARTFCQLSSFVILAAVVLGLLFLARRHKLAQIILKSFGIGISITATLTATVFSLGYAAYTWSFCGIMAAYILPMIIPLSVVVAVILTLRPSETASRSPAPL